MCRAILVLRLHSEFLSLYCLPVGITLWVAWAQVAVSATKREATPATADAPQRYREE